MACGSPVEADVGRRSVGKDADAFVGVDHFGLTNAEPSAVDVKLARGDSDPFPRLDESEVVHPGKHHPHAFDRLVFFDERDALQHAVEIRVVPDFHQNTS